MAEPIMLSKFYKGWIGLDVFALPFIITLKTNGRAKLHYPNPLYDGREVFNWRLY